ncbi:hypothetical protein [Candidatus Harpocratesius sp.]
MSFSFIAISKTGIPMFEYPLNNGEIEEMNINSVLFSGLLSAINTLSIEATGEMIGDIKFGAIKSTYSKDEYDNLYVVLTGEEISTEILKQIHVEMKALFINSLKQLKLDINPEKIEKIENRNIDKTVIESIFNPFYRMWNKKIHLTVNC